MSKWHGIMTVVAALLVLAAPVLAVDIEVPADIGGVSTNAGGPRYVYDFSGGNLALGSTNIRNSVSGADTTFTNINALSYTSGGGTFNFSGVHAGGSHAPSLSITT